MDGRKDSSGEDGVLRWWLRFALLGGQVLFGAIWFQYAIAVVVSYGFDETRQEEAPAAGFASWTVVLTPVLVCLVWLLAWYFKGEGNRRASLCMRYAAAGGVALWIAAYVILSRYTQHGMF
jgi:hypothetical protein